MKRFFIKLVFLIFSAITSTQLSSYKSSLISVRNEDVYTLKFTVFCLGVPVKTFDKKKELHFHRSSFKAHWNHWDKLIATKKDVGAIWLPFVTAV